MSGYVGKRRGEEKGEVMKSGVKEKGDRSG